jgi:hypothetical protein
MTVPNFLASSFYYGIGSSPITDVATVITDVRTILTVTNNPPWTEPVAGTFQSPVDAGGRFMRIALAKNTATRLNVTLQDQNLITLYAREFDILASAEVYYHTGQYHFVLESYNGGAISDRATAFILDVSPYALNASNNYVVGTTFRSTAGSNDSQGSLADHFFMIEAGATVLRQRMRGVGRTSATASVGLVDFLGNPQIFPVDIFAVPNSLNCWGGKLPQSYIVPQTVGAGTIKKIALDDGTLASFKTLQTSVVDACLIAIRVA